MTDKRRLLARLLMAGGILLGHAAPAQTGGKGPWLFQVIRFASDQANAYLLGEHLGEAAEACEVQIDGVPVPARELVRVNSACLRLVNHPWQLHQGSFIQVKVQVEGLVATRVLLDGPISWNSPAHLLLGTRSLGEAKRCRQVVLNAFFPSGANLVVHAQPGPGQPAQDTRAAASPSREAASSSEGGQERTPNPETASLSSLSSGLSEVSSLNLEPAGPSSLPPRQSLAELLSMVEEDKMTHWLWTMAGGASSSAAQPQPATSPEPSVQNLRNHIGMRGERTGRSFQFLSRQAVVFRAWGDEGGNLGQLMAVEGAPAPLSRQQFALAAPSNPEAVLGLITFTPLTAGQGLSADQAAGLNPATQMAISFQFLPGASPSIQTVAEGLNLALALVDLPGGRGSLVCHLPQDRPENGRLRLALIQAGCRFLLAGDEPAADHGEIPDELMLEGDSAPAAASSTSKKRKRLTAEQSDRED